MNGYFPRTDLYDDPSRPLTAAQRREHLAVLSDGDWNDPAVFDKMQPLLSPAQAESEINNILFAFVASVGTQVLLDSFAPGLPVYSAGWFAAIGAASAFFYFLQTKLGQ